MRNEIIPYTNPDMHTCTRTDRQPDRPTDRQTDQPTKEPTDRRTFGPTNQGRPTDRWTDQSTHRRIDRPTDTQTASHQSRAPASTPAGQKAMHACILLTSHTYIPMNNIIQRTLTVCDSSKCSAGLTSCHFTLQRLRCCLDILSIAVQRQFPNMQKKTEQRTFISEVANSVIACSAEVQNFKVLVPVNFSPHCFNLCCNLRFNSCLYLPLELPPFCVAVCSDPLELLATSVSLTNGRSFGLNSAKIYILSFASYHSCLHCL